MTIFLNFSHYDHFGSVEKRKNIKKGEVDPYFLVSRVTRKIPPLQSYK